MSFVYFLENTVFVFIFVFVNKVYIGSMHVHENIDYGTNGS